MKNLPFDKLLPRRQLYFFILWLALGCTFAAVQLEAQTKGAAKTITVYKTPT